MENYPELHITTNYSFLRGASHPEELFAQAAAYGIPALGIADHNSVAGIVRAWEAAKTTGVRLVAGARLQLRGGAALLAYPTNRPAWSRLCRLLTLGKARAGKGGFILDWDDLERGGEGLLYILLAQEPDGQLATWLRRLETDAPGHAYLGAAFRFRPNDAVRMHRLDEMARAARTPLVALGDVLYHHPARRILQDVMTCIREGCTIDDAGHRLEHHGERYLNPPERTAQLFARHPGALARAAEVADRCRFDPSELSYQYPTESDDPAEPAQATLERLTWLGAANRFPEGVPDAVTQQLHHELRLTEQLQYAPYFLTVNSIVRYARGRGILCQGRGSAANSAICYVLGITSIDPTAAGLLFERFVSAERHEPPDIDVDFEHEQREEVIQWVYEHYGRTRAALCATVIRYRARGAIREVGKVLGLTEDVTGALSSQVWGWSEDGVGEEHAEALNLNLEDPRLSRAIDVARQLIGFPRHLGTHPGGFVLTRDPLSDLVPIEPASMQDRQIIEWDKDDIDALKFMKVDVLGLGMLGCLRRAFDMLEDHRGLRHDLATIPPDDPATYDMICRADTLGAFQIESRAQMSMLPRMKPRRLYDLTIQVAIVRPGPIQGDMVHPYLRRREGKEKPEYPTPELEKVLKKTLGVPLFQEQAMQVAIHCAGFTPGEADQLRRAMATFKLTGGVSHFKGQADRRHGRPRLHARVRQQDLLADRGLRLLRLPRKPRRQLRHHRLRVFLGEMPPPRHLLRRPAQQPADGLLRPSPDRPLRPGPRRRGPPRSTSTTPAGTPPWRQMASIWPSASASAWPRACPNSTAQPSSPPAPSTPTPPSKNYGAAPPSPWPPSSAWPRPTPSTPWASTAAPPSGPSAPSPTLPSPSSPPPTPAASPARKSSSLPSQLTPMRPGRTVVEDYGSVGLTLRQHPVAFLRDDLRTQGMVTCADLATTRDNRRVIVPGIVLVRQKPGSAKGVMFITIEDETGIANLILWPSIFERQRRLVLTAGMIACHGRVQKEGGVIHVITERLVDLTPLLRDVGERDVILPTGRGDEARHGGTPDARNNPRHTVKPRDIYCPERLANGIKVPTRDFR